MKLRPCPKCLEGGNPRHDVTENIVFCADCSASQPFDTWQEKRAWWLSFADDDGNRGCCVVFADTFDSAIGKSHRLHINPGGEVRGSIVSEPLDPYEPNRLYSKDELMKLGAVTG